MASSPELFVVCKNCRSQVSPYITECPYCGTRLRKRAPKIEREDKAERKRRRRAPRPTLGPLRSGEIPGIRGDELAKPVATMALVAIGALWWLAVVPLRDEGVQLIVEPLAEWWQVLTAPFVHLSGWYQFAGLGAVGIYGWMLERRHGAIPMLLTWLLSASGSMAIVKAVVGPPEGTGGLIEGPFAMGATAGALGLLCAWAVPVLLSRRKHGEDSDDADLLGTGVIFVLLALMPAARDEISVVATAAAVVIGSVLGLLLYRLKPER
jgi:membrane associated rhomboid family serine protease